jgi:hypothetical protein
LALKVYAQQVLCAQDSFRLAFAAYCGWATHAKVAQPDHYLGVVSLYRRLNTTLPRDGVVSSPGGVPTSGVVSDYAAAQWGSHPGSVPMDSSRELPRVEFAFPGSLRDKLVGAILDGTKTSTTSMIMEYEVEDETSAFVDGASNAFS